MLPPFWLLILAAWLAAQPAGTANGRSCRLEPGERQAVVRVIDGETLALDDGSEVRLIGALSPRSPDSGANATVWPPEREATAELERLVLGRSVDLAFAGRRRDRYGRILAHVFADTGAGRVWVQGHMLAAGRARAYALPESAACYEELLAYERQARTTNAGLWSHAAYRIRSALHTRELLRLRSTYQIVEGRIAHIADIRGHVYLNFGSNWREDFTAGVKSAVRRTVFAGGRDPKTLEGRQVRIRGWIDRRNGPAIDVVHPGQIEVLSGEEGPNAADPPAPAPKSAQPPADPPPARRTKPAAIDL
ncbi:MAG: thermonuclease family protein [Hyphomicrobiaceae bacterium]